VTEDDDVEADYLAANDIVPEPEPRQLCRRAPLIVLKSVLKCVLTSK